MAKKKKSKQEGNGALFTTRVFNTWRRESFDPNIKQIKKNQENLFCLKKQVGEIRGFLIGPAADSLEVLADKDAVHTSPLVDVVRSIIRADRRRLGIVIISSLTVTFGVITWGVQNEMFTKLFDLLKEVL